MKKEQTRIRNDLLFKTNSFLYIVVTIIYYILKRKMLNQFYETLNKKSALYKFNSAPS